MSRRSRKVTAPEADLWRFVTRDVAPLEDTPARSPSRQSSRQPVKAAEMPAGLTGPSPTPGGLERLSARLSRSGAASPARKADSAKPAPKPTSKPTSKPASKRPRVLPPSYSPPQSQRGGGASGRPPALPGPGTALEARTRRRLNRGQAEPDARIDLHGMRQAAAHEALRSFILMARARGHRLVLVVTGKGEEVGTPARLAANEGRGVIRRAVPRWLALPDMAPHVVGHEPAGPRHGGSGALYVRLRR